MRIGVEPVVADYHLSFVMDVGSCYGNKLQIMHLHPFCFAFPVMVRDLALGLVKEKLL